MPQVFLNNIPATFGEQDLEMLLREKRIGYDSSVPLCIKRSDARGAAGAVRYAVLSFADGNLATVAADILDGMPFAENGSKTLLRAWPA